jgi:hypothetical protein
MAKRGTLTHRRTRRLAAILRVAPPYALGLMEALWHVTAEHAPAGDVGRMSDQDLADELYWDGDAAELVGAYVKAGVLERHQSHRLVVHGWSEHADNAVRHKLKRAGRVFWDGEPPFRRRQSEPDDGDAPTEHDQTATDHDKSPPVADTPRSDEIEPASNQRPATSASDQCQRPATSDQRPRTPPGPPAVAGGRAGGGPARVGDTLPGGSVVLELDERGPVVVAKPPRSARAEATAAAERVVVFATRRLGYRFDRTQRRALVQRLLYGETEAQLLAPYERQLAALEAADREPEDGPPDPGTVDEEAEALRLLAPPAAPPPEPRFMPSSTVAIHNTTRGAA